ncbi:MAG: hypothetical protein K2H95_04450 [Bacteroidales bacterium]|nr:hypothetical protein [Bacteroidales bacterium]
MKRQSADQHKNLLSSSMASRRQLTKEPTQLYPELRTSISVERNSL